MGYVVMEGGAEFGGMMFEPDLRAMQLAGGSDVPIRIIPAAAAPNGDDKGAGQNGVRWFQSLGATDVVSLPLVDRTSADDPAIADALRKARLIFILGGHTHYLIQTLSDSKSWLCIQAAYNEGAVIAGSSAGAMVLCEYYYRPTNDYVAKGLGLVSGACVLPHYNTFGKNWAPRLAGRLMEAVLIGIDEETAMINDGPRGIWRVFGKGMVTVYRSGECISCRSGRQFDLLPGSSPA
ncbi:MAG: Type 1 glutamine amidotransferase-like domain-containing protein [Deltaproteobacteria bacterium]|nr:Type 1 glutamine amidotransferase-like domain-containing protein [Deltaproteobacteria bacterium]MBW1962079.1 Type 1 glutamine amidotransferase-like domain-containing protein [Deltaproteobacteria bacterium]MBW1993787.1 Type 1 glutamine amidotransferase-like domain-containing protein [Deltaproteobacteria bacterium]MBW2151565.1 Type 1 glutamine amidotransferase-like domain-containing protein [Deltaproteobacteria bacterium]